MPILAVSNFGHNIERNLHGRADRGIRLHIQEQEDHRPDAQAPAPAGRLTPYLFLRYPRAWIAATHPSPTAEAICCPPQVTSPAAKTPGRFVFWVRSTATHCLWSRRMPARLRNGAVGVSRKMKTPRRRDLPPDVPLAEDDLFDALFAGDLQDLEAVVDLDALAGELVGRGESRIPALGAGDPMDPGAELFQGPDVLDGLVRRPVGDDVGAPVEGPVAGRAIADAQSGQPVLARDHPLPGERLPRGEDDGPGLEEGILGRDILGVRVEAQGDGVPGDDPGAEPEGVLPEFPEELERVDGRKARDSSRSRSRAPGGKPPSLRGRRSSSRPGPRKAPP